jgi:hypothetical protein
VIGFVYVPLATLFGVLALYGVGLQRSRRKAEAAREEIRLIEGVAALRDMRDWRDVTSDSVFKVDSVGEVEAPTAIEPAPVQHMRPRRITGLQIAWASLTLAALELAVDLAGPLAVLGRHDVMPAIEYDPRIFAPTALVTRVVSATIVSHRAPEPRWSAVRWRELRSWPLEPAPEFERSWRTTHHVSRHALREAPGAVAQRALWNASTEAWAAVQLTRFDDLAKVQIAVSPTMGLRLRPVIPLEPGRELVGAGAWSGAR